MKKSMLIVVVAMVAGTLLRGAEDTGYKATQVGDLGLQPSVEIWAGNGLARRVTVLSSGF